MVSDIIFFLLLILLNAFFVAAEFAITKVRLPQIQSLSNSGFVTVLAKKIIDNEDQYLKAIQLGITLSSVGLGWFTYAVFAQQLDVWLDGLDWEITAKAKQGTAFAIAFVIAASCHFIFAEMLPRSLAFRHPINTTTALAIPLRFFYLLFRPFNWVLNGVADLLAKLFRLQLSHEEDVHSEEELKMIIAESAEGGAIEASESELIQNVFDFDDRFVWQIFQPRAQIAAIEKDTPLEKAIEYVLQEGYSRFPVYEDSIDNILGFIHTKDLLMLARQNRQKKFIKDILRPIQYVSSNKKVLQLLRQFQKEHEQLAIVVNEFGGTVGLVTLEDIIEELVGEIQDEYDTENPIVEKTDDDTYRILAQNPLDEINEMVPEPFPLGEEYHTLSGLLLKVSEEIPEEGDLIQIGGYEVKIIKMLQASPEQVEVIYKKEKIEVEEP